MRDPLALAVMLIGTAVMAYGFWLTADAQLTGQGTIAWQVVLVVAGLITACLGGYAVGRSVADDGVRGSNNQ